MGQSLWKTFCWNKVRWAECDVKRSRWEWIDFWMNAQIREKTDRDVWEKTILRLCECVYCSSSHEHNYSDSYFSEMGYFRPVCRSGLSKFQNKNIYIRIRFKLDTANIMFINWNGRMKNLLNSKKCNIIPLYALCILNIFVKHTHTHTYTVYIYILVVGRNLR